MTRLSVRSTARISLSAVFLLAAGAALLAQHTSGVQTASVHAEGVSAEPASVNAVEQMELYLCNGKTV